MKDKDNLLGVLFTIKHLLERKIEKPPYPHIGENELYLSADLFKKDMANYNYIFGNLRQLEKERIIVPESISFKVDPQRLEEFIKFRREHEDRHSVVAQLYIKKNELYFRVLNEERRVQRLNMGSNLRVLIECGLKNAGNQITLQEANEGRDKADPKIRDIADTLSKDKAKALAPLIDIFFSGLSKYTVTVTPLTSVGTNTARRLLEHYEE